jgi:mannitol/fructose-specific phosphotransferase system IIA component (Ntr-type)
MHLGDLLTADDVVFGVRAADLGQAAADTLRRTLPSRGYSPEDVEKLVAPVIERERQSPTTCGTIAIPHAREPQLTSFLAAVGIDKDGVAGPGSPRVIIIFISPEGQRQEPLALLADVARMSRDSAAIDAIAAAATADDVLAIIRNRRG